MLQLDYHFESDRLVKWLPGPEITQEGARQFLSTVAGSMITVASLVLSMTPVALSFVSQQLGPRVLQFLIEDLTTKFVLGAFVAIFLFASIVLGTVGEVGDGVFVPRLSVYMTGVLAIFAFALMICFIHHISTQIQADVIVADLGVQFSAAARRMVRDKPDYAHPVSEETFARQVATQEASDQPVVLEQSGYVSSVDISQCLGIAAEHELCVRLVCLPGHFVVAGVPAMTVSPTGKLTEEVDRQLKAAIRLGNRRTRAEHVEFEINALAGVALRALSPGVNDPYTAMACIDRLADGLAIFLTPGYDRVVMRDDSDILRVLPYPQTFREYLDVALHPIRQAASDNPQVVLKLLRVIRELTTLSRTPSQLSALRSHADAIAESCKGKLTADGDVTRLDEALGSTDKCLKRFTVRLRDGLAPYGAGKSSASGTEK